MTRGKDGAEANAQAFASSVSHLSTAPATTAELKLSPWRSRGVLLLRLPYRLMRPSPSPRVMWMVPSATGVFDRAFVSSGDIAI